MGPVLFLVDTLALCDLLKLFRNYLFAGVLCKTVAKADKREVAQALLEGEGEETLLPS